MPKYIVSRHITTVESVFYRLYFIFFSVRCTINLYTFLRQTNKFQHHALFYNCKFSKSYARRVIMQRMLFTKRGVLVKRARLR